MRLNTDGVDENVYSNDVISFDEIEKTIVKRKSGKACGLDGIPNEILKNRKVVICLWYLFKKCFEIGTVSSMWAGALIKPTPKSRDKGPCVPLNHRGISLRYLKFTHQF